MTRHGVEVLLVDDCAADVDLTLRALKERASVGDVLGQYWLRMNLAPSPERAISGEPE